MQSAPFYSQVLPGNRHSEDGSNAATVTDLAWRAARPVQPLRELSELDVVLDANGGDRYLDYGTALCLPRDTASTSTPTVKILLLD